MQKIQAFFDDRTYTMTYVVYDDETRDAVIIDPVLDYDPAASKTWTESAEEVLAFTKGKELDVHYIIETHAHADHLSGSQFLKASYPDAPIGIGAHITDVQKVFKAVFNLPVGFPTDGSQFDQLFHDGETIQAGSLSFDVIHTPGHTPACVAYKFEDALFTGDAMFMPDMGTGRCDFPGGDAAALYDSIAGKLYALPDETRVFVGHDYQPGGRALAYETTIGAQKASNIQLTAETTRDEYIKFRNTRDAGLSAPKLLFQSVQVNVDAGHLPEPSENEMRYLRIPINAFKPAQTEDLVIEDI